jgi:3-phenylpropionate/cinnamic acid dioxygenase small subunit
MTELEQLLAREAIRETKARYCRFLDTKQWERWGEQFTTDIEMDVSEDVPEGSDADPIVRDREVVVNQVRMLVGAARTVHQVHASEITFTSPTEATVIWAMEDWVTFPDSLPNKLFDSLHGYGHYHETYRWQDGAWRIAKLKLTRLQQDFT